MDLLQRFGKALGVLLKTDSDANRLEVYTICNKFINESHAFYIGLNEELKKGINEFSAMHSINGVYEPEILKKEFREIIKIIEKIKRR